MGKINELLRHLKETDGSDLHLVAGLEPRTRRKGALEVIDGWPVLSDEQVREMMQEITTAGQWDSFAAEGDLDFAYGLPGVARFRANYFLQRRGAGAVFRIIPEDILTTEQLGLPEAVVNLANLDQGLALITGPLIGGVLFKLVGPEGAFILVACLYCLSGLSALMMGTIKVNAAQKRESVFAAVVQGLRYVKARQLLWSVLVVAVIINITGFSFHTTLMPIFARDVLDRDSVGLGLLLSFFGIGALVGSMIWASIPNLRHTGLLCILSVIGWHGTMIVFATSTNFYLSLGILMVTGMMFSSTLVLILTVLMKTAQPEFRGRIMGLRTLAI